MAKRSNETISKFVQYSPSAIGTYRFCEKKYYFNWLMNRKQGWRKKESHPWYRVYSLKRVWTRSTWAGQLYHQIISYSLRQVQSGTPFSEDGVIKLASELVEAQYRFSKNRLYEGMITSHAPTHHGISVFLALFDHVYALPDNDLLEETRTKLIQWLQNTFNWEGWGAIVHRIRYAKNVHIEPHYLHYTVAGARISARMDLGLEMADRSFSLYDWKCYTDAPDFDTYNSKRFKGQLLAYALWALYREREPLEIDMINAQVFYPTTAREEVVSFSKDDVASFELEVGRWVSFHQDVFDDVSQVCFDELNGPKEPGRSCPWCQYKSVCQEEIKWQELT